MNAFRSLKPGARGFTLIELLVVITIVSMLLALLIPSLQQARESSKVALCLSKLHQLDLYSRAYAQDNKQALPLLLERYSTTPNAIGSTKYMGWVPRLQWKGYIPGYVEANPNQGYPTLSIAQCPGITDQSKEPPTYVDPFGTSYGMNELVSQKLLNGAYSGAFYHHRFDTPRSPSERVLIGDSPANVLNGGNTNYQVFSRHPLLSTNLLFFDGRAKNFRLQEVPFSNPALGQSIPNVQTTYFWGSGQSN